MISTEHQLRKFFTVSVAASPPVVELGIGVPGTGDP
jgi:hypothetical protein